MRTSTSAPATAIAAGRSRLRSTPSSSPRRRPPIPQPLIDQLAIGGILVAPVGDVHQELVVMEKTANGLERREVIPVRFVPMTGEAQEKP